MGYGFFCGGDPRKFYPDPEMSTDEERARHKTDCEAWNRGEMPNVNGNAPHFRTDEHGGVMHVVPGGYGLGSYDDDDFWDDESDDEPDDEHPYCSTCECEACYDARTMARFRDEREPRAGT